MISWSSKILLCVSGVGASIAALLSLSSAIGQEGRESRAGAIVFRDVTKQAGLVDPLAGMMGHGAAWGDWDADGHVDLFVGGFCDRPDREYEPASGPVPSRLLRNLGDGRFAPVESPATMYGRASGAVFADLDNSGTLELYVANNAKERPRRGSDLQRAAQAVQSKLFRNDRSSLVDVTASSGACPEQLFSARNVGVLDYDNDGLLDLLVIEDRFTRSPRSVLLRNRGGLQFQDVTREANLPDDLYGLGLAIADVNEDDRPDFFVPHSNRLFLSRGDKHYREAVELADLFAWKPLDGEDWPCGAAFGDLNRDGRLDLVLSVHYRQARNRVFLNGGLVDGLPQFRDVTDAVGLGEVVPTKCPHVEIQDFDNDGWPDIYMSAAWLEQDGSVVPLVYRNSTVRDGVPRFSPPRSLDREMVYFPAGPSADFDRDGRIDLFLVNWFRGNHSRLLRNATDERHWLDVRVAGTRMNRMGVGAKVRIFKSGELDRPESLLGFQEISVGYGYASGQEPVCHFGLADHAHVDVSVKLPNGKAIVRRNMAANQVLRLEEP